MMLSGVVAGEEAWVAAEALLGSWNDTPARRAIADFVQAVGSEGSAGSVAPAERTAVFAWPSKRAWPSCATEPGPI
jgi:hypothetical protein